MLYRPKRTNSRVLKNITHVARMIMGLVFIISGFVKAIDPWGTSIKVDEYLRSYGWEELLPLSIAISIWLCGAELMMGLMLTFKVRIRFVSIGALFSMVIFTIITLLGATVMPVEDCGCFGHAVSLSPWQSFFKNLLLLPMAVIIYWRYRPDKIFLFKRSELILAALFFSISMGLGFYCYRHLPLIDFLPYKVGANLPVLIEEANKANRADKVDVVLVFKDKKRGDRYKEFKMEDTEWHNEDRYEWVETRTVEHIPAVKPLISEFALRDYNSQLVTNELLSTPGVLDMLVITSLSKIDEELMSECRIALESYAAEAKAKGNRVICITPDIITEESNFAGVECYNIDPITMKTMLRAWAGVVSLRDGVIERKSNCIDL